MYVRESTGLKSVDKNDIVTNIFLFEPSSKKCAYHEKYVNNALRSFLSLFFFMEITSLRVVTAFQFQF